MVKILGSKAPLALATARRIMDAQADKPIDEAIEIELAELAGIFSTADALEGLSSLGRRKPAYTGK
jgi:enoyl-CoA hydratase/carnithine racemase